MYGFSMGLCKSANCEGSKQTKQQHNKYAKDPGFQVGEWVFVYMPDNGQGKMYKFVKEFQGPFHIMAMYDNRAELQDISKPNKTTIKVTLNHVCRFPKEIKDLTEEITDVKVSEEVTKNDEESEAINDDQNLDGSQNDEDLVIWKGSLQTKSPPHVQRGHLT